jgi:hypothetical protein
MKNAKHIIIGTVVCAATLFIFLAFRGKLPENVPIQIRIDGSAGNTLPMPLFVFGAPIVFALANLVRGVSLAKEESALLYSFYVVPAISIVLSILMVVFAVSVG